MVAVGVLVIEALFHERACQVYFKSWSGWAVYALFTRGELIDTMHKPGISAHPSAYVRVSHPTPGVSQSIVPSGPGADTPTSFFVLFELCGCGSRGHDPLRAEA